MTEETSFAGFDVRLDPWAVEYGSETPTDFHADPDEGVEVDVSVERENWAPIVPAAAELPQALAIVDGVRRIEARLVVTKDGRVLHGALGSYGVGVVRCEGGHARFGEEVRGRVLIFGGGEKPPSRLTVSPGPSTL